MTKRALWLLTFVLGACSSGGGGATPDGAAGNMQRDDRRALPTGARRRHDGRSGDDGRRRQRDGRRRQLRRNVGRRGRHRIPAPTGTERHGARPVGTTPPAAWTNVTANLAGMASECGNTSLLAAAPGARHAAHDGGQAWLVGQHRRRRELAAALGHRGNAADHEPRLVLRLRPRAPDDLLGVGHLQRPGRVPNHRRRSDVLRARRRAPHRLGQRRPRRSAAPDAARGRPRAEADALPLGRRRSDDLDERRRQPAHGHELLHQRARPRQEHPPRRLLGLRGRHRRRLPYDRRRQDPGHARHDGVRRRGSPVGVGRDDLLVPHLRQGPHQEHRSGQDVDADDHGRHLEDGPPHRAARRPDRCARPQDADDLHGQGRLVPARRRDASFHPTASPTRPTATRSSSSNSTAATQSSRTRSAAPASTTGRRRQGARGPRRSRSPGARPRSGAGCRPS